MEFNLVVNSQFNSSLIFYFSLSSYTAVNQSIALAAVFMIAAASIGGKLFGILGMIFFKAIFAVIYQLIKEFVVAKENQIDKEKN